MIFWCFKVFSGVDKWNVGLYSVIANEIVHFRSKGCRVLVMGDLNGHIGCEEGVGISGFLG